MMADKADRLLENTSIGVIMVLLVFLVRFALQRSREHRMCDRMVHMARVAVAVLHLRMHVHPGHHEQPEGNPYEQNRAGPR